MRRDPSELRVRKPEVISIHRLLPRGSLESRRQTEANGFMGLGPKKVRRLINNNKSDQEKKNAP
jgi:hypothetical protein